MNNIQFLELSSFIERNRQTCLFQRKTCQDEESFQTEVDALALVQDMKWVIKMVEYFKLFGQEEGGVIILEYYDGGELFDYIEAEPDHYSPGTKLPQIQQNLVQFFARIFTEGVAKPFEDIRVGSIR